MEFIIDKIYKGFKLIKIENLDEIASKGLLFQHEKTGAKLIKIVNDDDNKVFSIGFRTPPEDNTGLPHILEHSVLCGSRKFDMKEPFVELLKGSLNTFLNAMTFPDKTIYPVASRNDKDFMNLMDVYLDAVLYPNIYKYKEIFMQEGWHYNIENKDDNLTYNGVVYNEMKGAYSSPDSILYRNIPGTLYKDTCYAKSSGGDPKEIPNLTYEQFIEFHKKYYHPSNSYMFLYGDGDTEKELEFIDKEYLIDFDKISVHSEIESQKTPEKICEVELKYGIADDDTLNGKSYYSLNFNIGEAKDYENYMAFEVLTHILLKSTAAPLKKALIDAGIGKAVSGEYDNASKQPTFTVLVKNSDMGKEQEFKKIVMDTLRGLSQKGIDKELIEGSINRIEFELREGDFGSYPKGLIYYLRIMDSWLYEGEPFIHLKYDKALENVKTALKSNYFENLIDKYLLNNPHSSLVALNPEKGLNEKETKNLEEKLNEIKTKLNENEIESLIKKCTDLKSRQNTPDTEENLKSIPVIELNDIDKNAEKLPIEEKELENIKILHHNFNTNKIAYVNMYFNTAAVDEELIPYITLLNDILGRCGTEKYDYGKLSNKVNINTGGISYTPLSISNVKKLDKFTPYMEVSLKCLDIKLDIALEILEEILVHTDLYDKTRIKQLISERKARIESSLIDNGHRVALRKVLSYVSNRGAYDEILVGLNYYNFLSKIEEDFEGNNVCDNLKKVNDLILNKNNLIISYSGDDEGYEELSKNLNILTNSLNSKKVKYNDYKFELAHKNEGLLTQGNVQYVAKGGNYRKSGFEYNGALAVLETISGFDYLWNNVRVKGGAYGVFMNFRRDGGAYVVSYRDPHVKETIKVYDDMYKYLEGFEVTDREMNKYIIGTIRKQDSPLTNSMKGEIAMSYYLAGVTYKDLQKERNQILGANNKVIKGFAPLVKNLMKQGYLCAIGNEAKIRENKDLFNELETVIK